MLVVSDCFNKEKQNVAVLNVPDLEGYDKLKFVKSIGDGRFLMKINLERVLVFLIFDSNDNSFKICTNSMSSSPEELAPASTGLVTFCHAYHIVRYDVASDRIVHSKKYFHKFDFSKSRPRGTDYLVCYDEKESCLSIWLMQKFEVELEMRVELLHNMKMEYNGNWVRIN